MTGSKQRHRRHHRPLGQAAGRVINVRPSMVLLDIPPSTHANDAVLARAREQWQQGDWHGLAQTSLESIEQHAQRARLALLLAAGHQQLGRIDAARRCANQALVWGCERRAVAQVLISGIHGSLARAAAIDDDAARSRRHLEAALSIAYPGQDVQALIAQRQLAQGAPPAPPAPTAAAPAAAVHAGFAGGTAGGGSDAGGAAPGAAATLPPAPPTLELQQLSDLLRKLQQDVAGLRRHFNQGLQRHATQQSQLLEAYLRIARAIDGRPELPSFQGWAVSADLGASLMDRVAQGGFDAIVEFGSGSSTLLIALASASAAVHGTSNRPAPVHLSLEHLPEHHARTRALLARLAPDHRVDLVLAPLVPQQAPGSDDGAPALFYDGHAALQSLAAMLAARPGRPRLLALVDGPPASTGPQARYPAVPMLLQYFSDAEVECIVDDYGRSDDSAVVQLWLEELRAAGRNPEMTVLPFVKLACQLHWSALPTTLP